METERWGSAVVPVPVRLLREILDDGTCPLHLRVRLQQLLEPRSLPSDDCDAATPSAASSSMMKLSPCLRHVLGHLPLAEVLSLRACCVDGLTGLMSWAALDDGEVRKVHSRIRTRLWISRVADINRGNADETVYETPLRRLADDALRRRMEVEMANARSDMDVQIRRFQMEVDRRMEQQAGRIHAIIEERVQQQINQNLMQEMERMRITVEEKVQARVRAAVHKEVHATICEMQFRLAILASENERLRSAFLEHLDRSELEFQSKVRQSGSGGVLGWACRWMQCCRRRGANDWWERRRLLDKSRQEAVTRLDADAAADFGLVSSAPARLVGDVPPACAAISAAGVVSPLTLLGGAVTAAVASLTVDGVSPAMATAIVAGAIAATVLTGRAPAQAERSFVGDPREVPLERSASDDAVGDAELVVPRERIGTLNEERTASDDFVGEAQVELVADTVGHLVVDDVGPRSPRLTEPDSASEGSAASSTGEARDAIDASQPSPSPSDSVEEPPAAAVGHAQDACNDSDSSPLCPNAGSAAGDASEDSADVGGDEPEEPSSADTDLHTIPASP